MRSPQPLHIRMLEDATFLRMMASGEATLCREDVRQVAMRLHLMALQIALGATKNTGEVSQAENRRDSL